MDFGRISFNTSTGDNETQELSGWYGENAFFWIELDVVCSEVVECEPPVVYQRVDVFGFDDHIIYVCLYRFADLFLQTCLEKQIGKTVEAYVDDVVVKTKHVDSLINDWRLTFDNL